MSFAETVVIASARILGGRGSSEIKHGIGESVYPTERQTGGTIAVFWCRKAPRSMLPHGPLKVTLARQAVQSAAVRLDVIQVARFPTVSLVK